MEVQNFEIQAGDHKQGVRRGSQMTTKVTNKSRVSSRRSQAGLLEASTRTEDKDVRSF